MELGGYGFEKTELLKIAEEIYDLKSKKQDLEFTLHSEQFHYKYIPKRKNIVEHEVFFRLLWIIPLTIVVATALSYINYVFFSRDEIDGLSFMSALFVVVICGYPTFKLWKREIHMLILLGISKNPEKAGAFFHKYDINTFQRDETISRKRIAMLEEQISGIETKIKELEEQQKQLLVEKRRSEDFLRNKGVLFDEDPTVEKKEGKFSLREESIGMGDVRELFDYYSREEQYIYNQLTRLDSKLQLINKEITKIDDDFEMVKKTFVLFVIIYILVVLVQVSFQGMLAVITSLICSVAAVFAVLYIEAKCKRPILLYLIEHENNLVQEYAFRNDMMPVRYQRQELVEKVELFQKELDEIKKKKRELDDQ